jgi:hypothetical protein
LCGWKHSSTTWDFQRNKVLQSWIPSGDLDKWFFSANVKGWTSNLHRLELLNRVFEPATRAKANAESRLLIWDGHDSHISGSFIARYLQNRITLLILQPHTSHLLESLDVAIFGSLKKRLTASLCSPQSSSIYAYRRLSGWTHTFKLDQKRAFPITCRIVMAWSRLVGNERISTAIRLRFGIMPCCVSPVVVED